MEKKKKRAKKMQLFTRAGKKSSKKKSVEKTLFPEKNKEKLSKKKRKHLRKKNARTFPAVVNPKPRAIAIYCIDPRFQKAFREYIEKVLGFREGEVIHLTIAGGPAPLAHPDVMRSRCRYLVRQIIFSCGHFPIELVLPMGHEDCGYYRVVPKTGRKSKNRESDDLPLARKMLDLFVPEGVKIDTHYAFFANKKRTRIAFRQAA